MGICELLVARRLTRKVVLTRLPKGHTHEDVDAIFGNIWTYIEGKVIPTPQAYKRALKTSLAQRNIACVVEDVLCVPDYQQWMSEYVDPQFGKYSRMEWTQLQFTFTAVDHCKENCDCAECSKFPTRVKVTYRAYVQDEVFEVFEDNDHIYGFDFMKTAVHTHPKLGPDCDSDGMFLLSTLPDGTKPFVPQPFVSGSRKQLEHLVRRMTTEFVKLAGGFLIKIYFAFLKLKFLGVKEEWDHWLNSVAPKSDDANEYCRDQQPLRVPFHERLFSSSPINSELYIQPRTSNSRGEKERPTYETTNSVDWTNRERGRKREFCIWFKIYYLHANVLFYSCRWEEGYAAQSKGRRRRFCGEH